MHANVADMAVLGSMDDFPNGSVEKWMTDELIQYYLSCSPVLVPDDTMKKTAEVPPFVRCVIMDYVAFACSCEVTKQTPQDERRACPDVAAATGTLLTGIDDKYQLLPTATTFPFVRLPQRLRSRSTSASSRRQRVGHVQWQIILTILP